MEKLKLVVVAVQYGYLKKITGQLRTMFGERIEIRSFQLGMFDKETIGQDEVVFSAIPNFDKLVYATFPRIRGFIKAKRSINLVNTGEILALEKGRRILVVGDHESATQKIINELRESNFIHDYIPFSPGKTHWDSIDIAVTTGDIELVPDGVDHVVNIGLRVISLETMAKMNRAFSLGLSSGELDRQYILSLVYVSSNWPVSRKNKYISNWIGTKKDHHSDHSFKDFIANSPAMQAFIKHAKALCQTNHCIHIDGALGVGKKRVAIAIHNESPLPRGKFLSINCTSSSHTLESSLFGWEEGGSIYPGLLESANNGTACVEEVEYMSQPLQEKLAGFLSEGSFVRAGGSERIRTQVRVVTTATLPLTQAFKEKKIRQALYHHLSLHICTMPPLSLRADDFDLLIRKYFDQELNRPELTVDPEALKLLKEYSWEGNVQEFYNVLFHLACLGEKKITTNLLPFYIYQEAGIGASPAKPGPETGNKSDQPSKKVQGDLQGRAITSIIQTIEKTGFLKEHLEILDIYYQGKKENRSFGRAVVIEHLKKRDMVMTKQQLRLKQERLKELGLLNVMKGRAGSTISREGEVFLKKMRQGK